MNNTPTQIPPSKIVLTGTRAQFQSLLKLIGVATVHGSAGARELLAVEQWVCTAAPMSPPAETATAPSETK